MNIKSWSMAIRLRAKLSFVIWGASCERAPMAWFSNVFLLKSSSVMFWKPKSDKGIEDILFPRSKSFVTFSFDRDDKLGIVFRFAWLQFTMVSLSLFHQTTSRHVHDVCFSRTGQRKSANDVMMNIKKAIARFHRIILSSVTNLKKNFFKLQFNITYFIKGMTFAILTIDFVHEITIDIWFLVTRFIENIFS